MRRKQVIVLGLVLVIIAVGVLQYNYGGIGDSTNVGLLDGGLLSDAEGTDLEDLPGAAVYVDNGDAVTGNEQADAAINQNSQAAGFFAEARMERDKTRSKVKEELKGIALNNTDGTVSVSGTTTGVTSAEAQEQLVEVIRRSEAEGTIETLIRQKGFEDAIVYYSDSGSIDVVVKATSLNATQVAQISDIVTRHSKVAMENITVKNVN